MRSFLNSPLRVNTARIPAYLHCRPSLNISTTLIRMAGTTAPDAQPWSSMKGKLNDGLLRGLAGMGYE